MVYGPLQVQINQYLCNCSKETLPDQDHKQKIFIFLSQDTVKDTETLEY